MPRDQTATPPHLECQKFDDSFTAKGKRSACEAQMVLVRDLVVVDMECTAAVFIPQRLKFIITPPVEDLIHASPAIDGHIVLCT